MLEEVDVKIGSVSTPLETKASAARSGDACPPSLGVPASRLRRLHLPRLQGALVRRVRLDSRHLDAEGRPELAGLSSSIDAKSSFYLGLDDFLGQLPILLFTIIGGVIADRHDRRQLLLGSQYVQMATAFTLALLVLTHHVQIWHILALSFTAGLAQAFGGPAYQSLVPSLVHKKDLPNAIALNSIQFNLARVFGPLLSSTTMAAFGAAACFGLNGLSFLVVIVALMSLSVKHLPPAERKPMLEEMKGGFTYARSEPTIIAHHRARLDDDVPGAAAADVPAGLRPRASSTATSAPTAG